MKVNVVCQIPLAPRPWRKALTLWSGFKLQSAFERERERLRCFSQPASLITLQVPFCAALLFVSLWRWCHLLVISLRRIRLQRIPWPWNPWVATMVSKSFDMTSTFVAFVGHVSTEKVPVVALYMEDPAGASMTAETADLYELMKRTLVLSEFFVFASCCNVRVCFCTSYVFSIHDLLCASLTLLSCLLFLSMRWFSCRLFPQDCGSPDRGEKPRGYTHCPCAAHLHSRHACAAGCTVCREGPCPNQVCSACAVGPCGLGQDRLCVCYPESIPGDNKHTIKFSCGSLRLCGDA